MDNQILKNLATYKKGGQHIEEDPRALATGAFVNGVNTSMGVEANAELEKGEHVQFIDGSIAKVLGERHSNGGTPFYLGDYERVLSDTEDLPIGVETAKNLRKTLGLKHITKNNTYSDVIDKYAKSIGYYNIIKDQTDLFKQAEKWVTNVEHKPTAEKNRQLYASKIQEVEELRLEKEKELSKVFDLLFLQQEADKGTDPRDLARPEGEIREQMSEGLNTAEEQLAGAIEAEESVFSEEEFMQFGGQLKKIESLSKKNGIPARAVFDRLVASGKLKKYEEGAQNNPKKSGITNVKNEVHVETESIKQQHADKDKKQFGKNSLEETLKQLYKSFAVIMSSPDFGDIFTIDDNGQIKINEAYDKGKLTSLEGNKEIRLLQEKMQTQMKASAEYIVNNEDKFTDEAVKYAENYLKNELFLPDATKHVRMYDGKLGDFTSGRFGLGLSLVTPEELKTLNDKGIYTLKQLKLANFKDLGLSEQSIKNINDIDDPEGDIDFTIGIYTPEVAPEEEKVAEDPDNKVKDVTDGLTMRKMPRSRMFFSPGHGIMSPDPLIPEGMFTTETSRIDPLRVGIERQLATIQDSRNQTMDLMKDLPSGQRAALAASTLASSLTAEEDAITKAVMHNAQQQVQTDQYNNQQADMERQYNLRAMQDFETRYLRALDLTSKDRRDYYAALNTAHQKELNRQMKLNTLDNMFEDISLDPWGVSGYYNPTNPLQVGVSQNAGMYYALMNPTPSGDDSKKKKEISDVEKAILLQQLQQQA